ncbi:uncharacterized protein LOC111092897 isoform X4 [Canis lupus familiaris]|uniref:uncharacterized protein LOC111092897 isoform X4 n=1 Tax=Canis lupus familiaris TaxID=9615 RepID=UPI0018F4148B|nr:uncharacterized protein LOC111092897 isoform X4 [Canis lupus familiaris]
MGAEEAASETGTWQALPPRMDLSSGPQVFPKHRSFRHSFPLQRDSLLPSLSENGSHSSPHHGAEGPGPPGRSQEPQATELPWSLVQQTLPSLDSGGTENAMLAQLPGPQASEETSLSPDHPTRLLTDPARLDSIHWNQDISLSVLRISRHLRIQKHLSLAPEKSHAGAQNPQGPSEG